MIFRKLTSADYEQFQPMIDEFRPAKFTEEEFISLLEYMSPFSQIWVVEDNNEIIATGTIIYEKKFIFNLCTLAHIEDVCVKREHRKKGIGKQLILHLLNEAKTRKCYKITLDCNVSNVDFYLACGLEQRGVQMTQLL
jgi:glucosamine-phosphate N-acetyltransferase